MGETAFEGVEVIERHGRYFVLMHGNGDVLDYGPFSREAAQALAQEEEARIFAEGERRPVRINDPLGDLRAFLKTMEGAFQSG